MLSELSMKTSFITYEPQNTFTSQYIYTDLLFIQFKK